MTEDEKWTCLLRSINRAARILNLDLTELDMPEYPNWWVGRRMHENLWGQVYLKKGR